MKHVRRGKLILAVLLCTAAMCMQSFAAVTVTEVPNLVEGRRSSDRFPFELVTDTKLCGRLCYAGHMANGGIFYDDGAMILPGTKFSVAAYPGGEEHFYELSAEVTLIYENPQNSGCTREIIRKYPAGSLEPGKFYEVFTDTTAKGLLQRKKLYSSDLLSVRIALNCGDRTKNTLFYVAKDNEYAEAMNKQ